MFNVPAVVVIDLFLQNRLPVHQTLHLIGVFIYLRFAEACIYLFIFLYQVHDLLYSLLDNLANSARIINKRILWKESD